MPFSGSGIFSRLYNWTIDRDSAIPILASKVDAETNGITAAINDIVNGTQAFVAPLRGSNGTVSLPGHSFSSDTNTGLYRISEDNLGVATNGTRVVTFTDAQVADFANTPLVGGVDVINGAITDVAAIKTKTDFISVTQAVDLDIMESAITDNVADIAAIELKTDFISVTQAVDLDTIGTDVAVIQNLNLIMMNQVSYNALAVQGYINSFVDMYTDETGISADVIGITDIALTAISVVASSVYSGSFPATNATDDNDSTYWTSANGVVDMTFDIEHSSLVPAQLTYLSKSAGYGFSEAHIDGWDGSSWNVIRTLDTQTTWGAGEKRVFDLAGATAYTKTRLHITAKDTGVHVEAATMELFEKETVGSPLNQTYDAAGDYYHNAVDDYGTADETATGTNSSNSSASNVFAGVKFTATSAADVTGGNYLIDSVGTAGNMHFELWNDVSGSPSTQAGADSATVAWSVGTVTADFPSAITLVDGNDYWLLAVWESGVATPKTAARTADLTEMRTTATNIVGNYTNVDASENLMIAPIVSATSPNMTLQSISFTAAAVPATLSITMLMKQVDAVTMNTDVKMYGTRDGGTTWALATLTLVQVMADGTELWEDSAVDVSGQPSGTDVAYKIETLNNKSVQIHGMLEKWGS